MFFTVSKLFAAIVQPMFWVALWWFAALLLLPRRSVAARRMLWAGLAMVGLLGFQAIPDALLRPLENRYAPPPEDSLAQYAGVIVLGGATRYPEVLFVHNQVDLGEAAERMSLPVGLMRRHPNWTLVFSGGEGRLVQRGFSEAELARAFYEQQGLEMHRVLLEGGSRNTRENAQQVARLLGERCQNEAWLLVTSAWHMPRSLPEFEAVGCNVTPYPVDFRTGTATPLTEYSLAQSLLRWQVALHEWLGLLAYQLTRP